VSIWRTSPNFLEPISEVLPLDVISEDVNLVTSPPDLDEVVVVIVDVVVRSPPLCKVEISDPSVDKDLDRWAPEASDSMACPDVITR
jgi:hypothetical protein